MTLSFLSFFLLAHCHHLVFARHTSVEDAHKSQTSIDVHRSGNAEFFEEIWPKLLSEPAKADPAVGTTAIDCCWLAPISGRLAIPFKPNAQYVLPLCFLRLCTGLPLLHLMSLCT